MSKKRDNSTVIFIFIISFLPFACLRYLGSDLNLGEIERGFVLGALIFYSPLGLAALVVEPLGVNLDTWATAVEFAYSLLIATFLVILFLHYRAGGLILGIGLIVISTFASTILFEKLSDFTV